jgi:hypothetical protein
VTHHTQHPFNIEWIYKRAGIDQSQIVWARPVDPSSDARLVKYLGNREVWVAEVDAKPVRISQWRPPTPDKSGSQ